MAKFIVNNRTDTFKNGLNLFLTITNCRIARSRSLTRHINYKFLCLSAYFFIYLFIIVIYTTYKTKYTNTSTYTVYNNYKIYNYYSPLHYQQKYITIQLLTHYLQYNVITGFTYNNTIVSLTLQNNMITFIIIIIIIIIIINNNNISIYSAIMY